jgi:deoxycytidylate deaminase
MNDREIMEQCYDAASFSPCKKGRVGAVVIGTKDGVDYSNKAVANTVQRACEWLPTGVAGMTLPYLKCESGCACGKAVHAEMYAIHSFVVFKCFIGYTCKVCDFDSITLYTTCHPCAKCLREIVKFGVTHLIIGTGAAKEDADRVALWQAMEDGLEVRYIL